MGPRAQILETAGRLFYTQGYAQTGINQVIAESGVAKRTFYHHFVSKEALGEAYLDAATDRWLEGLRAAAASKRTPGGVVRGLFDFVHCFAVETEYRGCGIANLAAEFADAGSPVRARAAQAKDAQRALLRELFGAVGTPRDRADAVHVLVEGAVAAAAVHRDTWPIRAARSAAAALIEGEETT